MLVINKEILSSNDINKELHDEEDREERDIDYKEKFFITNNIVDDNINCEMLSCVLTPMILEDSIDSILIDKNFKLIKECKNNLRGFIDRISDNIFPYLNTLEDELINLLNNHYTVKGEPFKVLRMFLELRGSMSKFIDIGYIASNRGRCSVPTNNRDVEDKNIVYTFKNNKLLEIVPDIYGEEAKEEPAEDCITYACCFLLFINIAIVYLALRETFDNIDNKTLKRLIYAVQNKTKLALLTGFKVSCEFILKDIDFREVFLDLKELNPKNPREIGIKCNDEKRVITITIHNNVLVTQALRNEGYRRVWNDYDKSLDNKSTGEIKIMKGSTPNSIKISAYVSGKRTISRLFFTSGNPKENLYLPLLNEEFCVESISNVISFYFRAVLEKCCFKPLKGNDFSIARKLISESSNDNRKNNMVTKLLITYGLYKLPKKDRERMINKVFDKSDKKQKSEIRRGIINLEEMVKGINLDSERKEPALLRVYKLLGMYYGW